MTNYEQLERNIFNTPQGKRALRLGVAASFLTNCMKGKKCSEFTETDFTNLKVGKEKALEAFETLTDAKDPIQIKLRSIYEGIMEKESKLQKLYGE